jgi:hypothetical protein
LTDTLNFRNVGYFFDKSNKRSIKLETAVTWSKSNLNMMNIYEESTINFWIWKSQNSYINCQIKMAGKDDQLQIMTNHPTKYESIWTMTSQLNLQSAAVRTNKLTNQKTICSHTIVYRHKKRTYLGVIHDIYYIVSTVQFVFVCMQKIISHFNQNQINELPSKNISLFYPVMTILDFWGNFLMTTFT